MPPPKKKTIGKPAVIPKNASQALVSTGPKHVSANVKGKPKTGPTEKPTTTRALILRNGKAGARGTGELMLVSKLTGREKLDLLAEDLQNKFTSAVMSPFHLERCLKIAESQYSAALDDIHNLRDPQLFKSLIEEELRARTDLKRPGFKLNADYIAEVIGVRIHNAYTIASAWKLITRQLYALALKGVTDGQIKQQLKEDEATRGRFLVLYDLVNVIVEMTQAKFSLLATTTDHFKRYFKEETAENGEKQVKFDWAGAGLKEAARSFMDSIIIELCFPRAPYPKAILYQVLRDAVEEAPKEAKRFPQALWDALGDLSVIVELQTLLEAPLVQPDGQSWKAAPRTMSEDYEDWVDAQIYSEKAAAIHNYKDIVWPLEKAKSKVVVDNVWKYIDLNYKTVAGEGIDAMWGLAADLVPSPQWHSFYIPGLDNMSDDEDGPSGLKKPIRRLAITDGRDEDQSDSMPELQSVSNSSDEDDSDVYGDESDDESDSDESDDSGYDTEQEDELREMLREAMDIAHEADWLNSAKVEGELDPLSEEDRKGNPFLKLLGSLRGRMFSSNAKLKTTDRKEPLKPKLARRFTPSGAPKEVPKGAPPPPKPAAPPKPKQEAPKSHKATVEEVEDEEEPSTAAKKKKKKYKKKKKSAAGPADTSITEEPTAPSPPVSPPTSPKAPAPKSPSKKGPSQTANVGNLPSFGSTPSLPIGEATAQSARAYLQAEHLDQEKAKVKSRPSHATVFGAPQQEKSSGMSGMFSKIMGKGKKEEEPQHGAKHSWFSRLGRKTKGLMHQLLNTAENDTQGLAPMKWENFLKIMREMGFDYDPSTAGSSVRFDPPDKRDKPITFHKPHPDPTLQPVMLKSFAKRLKRQYGWEEADFLKHA